MARTADVEEFLLPLLLCFQLRSVLVLVGAPRAMRTPIQWHRSGRGKLIVRPQYSSPVR